MNANLNTSELKKKIKAMGTIAAAAGLTKKTGNRIDFQRLF